MRCLRKLFYYIRPSWREMPCPYCGEVLRARSGFHMSDVIGHHAREFHPAERTIAFNQFVRRMSEVDGDPK